MYVALNYQIMLHHDILMRVQSTFVIRIGALILYPYILSELLTFESSAIDDVSVVHQKRNQREINCVFRVF